MVFSLKTRNFKSLLTYVILGLGWIGWLAIPVQDSSPKKKEIHAKTNGNTWVPKNIEIRAMAMHVNAEP